MVNDKSETVPPSPDTPSPTYNFQIPFGLSVLKVAKVVTTPDPSTGLYGPGKGTGLAVLGFANIVIVEPVLVNEYVCETVPLELPNCN